MLAIKIRGNRVEEKRGFDWRIYWEKDFNLPKELNYHTSTRKPFFALMERNIARSPKADNLKVLEIGCGTGIDSFLLRKKYGVNVFCLDFSYAAVKLAKNISGEFDTNATFVNGDTNNLCFKDKSFDIVFSQGLLEHFRDPSAAIAEQVRLLKDNGMLIINVPQKFTLYTIFKHWKIKKGKWPYGWETQFSYKELRALGVRFGLEKIDVCGHEYDSYIRFFNFALLRNIVKRLQRFNPLRELSFFRAIDSDYDRLWDLLERKWGHYFLLNIAVVFRKRAGKIGSKSKICIICPSFPGMHCGIADYIARLVESLKKERLEIVLITSKNKKICEFIKNYSASGVSILPVMRSWGWLGLRSLCGQINKVDPDIVHIQYQWWLYHKKAMITLLPLFMKLFKRKIKVITTFHDLRGPYLFPKAGGLRKMGIKALAKFSDKIITTNGKDTQDLIRLFQKAGEKLSHIPTGSGLLLQGSQVSDIDRIRKEHRDSQGQIIISNFGFMLPYKGLEDLLEAMKVLIGKKYPVKLLAIGGFNLDRKVSSSYFGGLQKQARDLQIDHYVEWLGHRSPQEVESFLSASDICVLPYKDGVSERRTSFITVLSLGIPIITTRLDNAPERLIDHENVLLVSPDNPQQIVLAIEELIKSAQLREKLAKAARKLYEEEYSWDIIADKTERAYFK